VIDISGIDVEPCQAQPVSLFGEKRTPAIGGGQGLVIEPEQEQRLDRSTERARQLFLVAFGFEECGRVLVRFDGSRMLIECIERVRSCAQAFRQGQSVANGFRDGDGKVG